MRTVLNWFCDAGSLVWFLCCCLRRDFRQDYHDSLGLPEGDGE